MLHLLHVCCDFHIFACTKTVSWGRDWALWPPNFHEFTPLGKHFFVFDILSFSASKAPKSTMAVLHGRTCVSLVRPPPSMNWQRRSTDSVGYASTSSSTNTFWPAMPGGRRTGRQRRRVSITRKTNITKTERGTWTNRDWWEEYWERERESTLVFHYKKYFIKNLGLFQWRCDRCFSLPVVLLLSGGKIDRLNLF